jgi:hypothetical protein
LVGRAAKKAVDLEVDVDLAMAKRAQAASLYAAIGIFDELGFSLRLNYHPNLEVSGRL